LLQFAAFFGVILTLTGLCWLLVGSFLHDLVPGGYRTVFIAWAVSLAPMLILYYNISTGCYPSAWLRVYVFRVFWYAQLLMLPLALMSGAAGLLALPFGAGEIVGRVVVLVGGGALIALGIAGYFGSRRLTFKEITLKPSGMPDGLNGLRIVQLTDLHVGPHTSRAQLAKIAGMVRDARPHILAYTGDQVDDYPHDVADLGEAFGDLTASLGVYAIAGNHDVYAGWSEVRRGLEALGIRVLVNEAVRLQRCGDDFWLAGTGDPAGHQFVRGSESAAPDIGRTMAAIPRGAFSVVLAHNPALFKYLAERGANVVLSGHTHHGQFSIPSKNWSLASMFLEFAMGTYERNGSLLYVSPGTNYWGIPFRIGAWPEVTLITLGSTD
jgi:predicted MPP superfamily phosphohydrolase